MKYKENNKKEILRAVSKVNTSWGNVADWYDGAVERAGSYQKDLILPNLIRLVSANSGEKIIDIACGQGFFSRELAKIGVSVTAVDVSPELIKIAKERSRDFKINYFVASADKLARFQTGSFDKAIMVLAIQDIENLSGVLSEASRVLKSGGEFFIVINHPTFRIPKRTAWFYDDKRKIQSRMVDEYMSEARIKMEVHPGMKNSESTTYFHRPLQTYFKAFQKTGFVVSRLEEWVSTKQSEVGPRAIAENKARREFPLFMALVLNKIKK